MTVPSPMSLNYLVTSYAGAEKERTALTAALSVFTKPRAVGEIAAPYEDQLVTSDGQEEFLLKVIFAETAQARDIRQRVFGDLPQREFKEKFDHSRKMSADALEDIAEVFLAKSFPETYFHPLIAQALANTKVLTNKDSVLARVVGTAKVMSGIVAEASLPQILALAASHALRPKLLYTQETIEYTLLTFSLFGFKHARLTDKEWFFFWKIFGSMMGLDPQWLHDDRAAAKERMQRIRAAFPLAQPLTPPAKQLLDAFVTAFYCDDAGVVKPENVREQNAKGYISKRMHKYLVESAKWPAEMARVSFKQVVPDD